MLKFFTLILFFCLNASVAFAQTENEKLEWHTDMTKAYEISKASNKPIFAFFTGSDWCGWCHKLQREVFAKPEFVEWAQKNVVLVELDFPAKKQLPQELVAQNTSLQQFFKVRGFPTIWLFDLSKDEAARKFNISAWGSLGYPQSAEEGKEEIKFLKDASAIMANRKSTNP
jgi:Protein of unknown function, DUF255.